MKSTFRPTSPDDYQRIKPFLSSAFQGSPDEPFLTRAHMEWKYWDPRPGWDGSRSYVLERDAQILAHGCAWPVLFQSSAGSIRALHLIDWAAGRTAIGSGAVLLDKMASLVDCIISVGGSEITKRVLPRLGFSPVGEFRLFARPLRPFRQVTSHQRKDWKLPVRLARNLIWSRSADIPAGWQSRLTEPQHIDSWPHLQDGALYPVHSPEFYDYVLRCPTAKCRLFSVQREKRPEGYFCLSFVPGQARIAEMWMNSDDPAVWAAGYALAVRESVAMGAAEIIAASSSQVGWDALAAAGYHFHQTVLILARVLKGLTLSALQMQMVDGDAFFLHHGKPEYMT